MLDKKIVNMDVDVTYPELGTVAEQRVFYKEGEVFIHPCGVKYIRRNGNWEVYASS